MNNDVVKYGYRGRKQYKKYGHTASRIFYGHYVRIRFNHSGSENYKLYWNAYEVNDFSYEEGYSSTIDEAIRDVEDKLGLGWKWYDSINELPRRAKYYLS